MSYFFTADYHFGHTNIYKWYRQNKYSSVDEMDEILIQNWNSKVSDRDTVYFLGDFAWKDPVNYVNRLKGNIILIMGNHDYRWKKRLSLFKEVKDYMVLNVNKTPIVLSHYAFRVWYNSHYNSWHLYGHSHGKLSSLGKSIDIGVDAIIDRKHPLSFDEIKNILDVCEDNPSFIRILDTYK